MFFQNGDKTVLWESLENQLFGHLKKSTKFSETF